MQYRQKNISTVAALWLGALVFSLPGSSHAQLGSVPPLPQIKKAAGPTLEETTQWITQKVAAFPAKVTKFDGGSSEQSFEVNFENCIITASERKRMSGYATRTYYTTATADLSALSTSISFSLEWGANPWYLMGLPSADGQKTARKAETGAMSGDLDKKFPLILKRLLNDNPGAQAQLLPFGIDGVNGVFRIEKNEKLYLLVPDLEIAERLTSALKHAIVLCQQKSLENKAAQPPRPKELF